MTGLINFPAMNEEKGKKWIQQAIKKPGALKKQLGIPTDKKIPAEKLAAATKKGGVLGKRARLAMTLRKLKESQHLTDDERGHIDEMISELEMVPRPFIHPDMNKDGVVDEKDRAMQERRRRSLAEGDDVSMNIDNQVDDHEGDMAKSSLLALHKQAGELYNMISEDEELEGWVQAKITKAADYINAVYNNMQYEKNKPGSVGTGMGAPADRNPDQMMESVEPLEEKAPEGWEATVKKMKKHKEIDNPWALAHWMKSKGYHPKAKVQSTKKKLKKKSR
jgi:hypothetical protein